MSEAPVYDEQRERRIAVRLVVLVLVTLTVVKPLGGIPVVGTVAFTIAAVMQLYLPLWRIDQLGLDYDFVGLSTHAWRSDLKVVLILVGLTFPPYILGHHLYMTHAHDWLRAAGLGGIAIWVPSRSLRPTLPHGTLGLVAAGWFFLKTAATHSLGVALPEETFYRGYLQPRLESLWPPVRTVFGTRIGRGALVASALFAAGHFLGEWNPLRLGPFLPGLVFAWQRNRTQTVFGGIVFHAACNVLGEVLFTLYAPG